MWRRLALLRRFWVLWGCPRRGASAKCLKHNGPSPLLFELLLMVPAVSIGLFEAFPQIRHLAFEMSNERVPLVPCRFHRGRQGNMPDALDLLALEGASLEPATDRIGTDTQRGRSLLQRPVRATAPAPLRLSARIQSAQGYAVWGMPRPPWWQHDEIPIP